MLTAAIWLLILAVVAAILGFGGIAGAAAGLAKPAFVILLFLESAVVSALRGRPPVVTTGPPGIEHG